MEKHLAETRRRFVYGPLPSLFDELDKITQKITGATADAAATFKVNVDTALSVASIPFLMANFAEQDSQFQRIFAAERIRMVPLRGDVEVPGANEHARRIASERTALFIKENTDIIAENTLMRLSNMFSSDQMRTTASELLLETLVMLWGSFEILTINIIKSYINQNPELSILLINSDKTRKHFPSKGVPVELLSEFGFRADGCMGEIIFRERSFDSLAVIRDVFGVIFSSNIELITALANPNLWRIWQQRHLIAHKRGVIDKLYIDKTGDAREVGVKLELFGPEIDESAQIILSAALACLRAVSNLSDGSAIQESDSI